MKIITLLENTPGANAACKFEHGLSFYIETEKHKMLFDTGASDFFSFNADLVNVDLKAIDLVVLSHGHYDHAGGIPTLHKINPKVKIIAQNTCKGLHWNGETAIGIDPAIPSYDQFYEISGDLKVDDELFIFTGVKGNKYPARGNLTMAKEENGKKVRDDFTHEQNLVISSDGKKVLICGCAHHGIINILDHYYGLFNSYPDVVIGGFHLKMNEYSEEDIANIKAIANECKNIPAKFYTGHCTGPIAYPILKEIMGEQLEQLHTCDQVL